MDAYDTVEAYYALRQEYAGVKRPARTPKKIVADAEAYLQWCDNHKVEPAAFLKTQFEFHRKKRHTFYPALRTMRSIKLLSAYRECGFEGKDLEAKRYARLKDEMPSGFEATVLNLRALPQTHQERMRAMYVRQKQVELCSAEHQIVGGYDPRSKVCPTCPFKGTCLMNLNRVHGFDVGALRVNVLHRLPVAIRKTVRSIRSKEQLAG